MRGLFVCLSSALLLCGSQAQEQLWTRVSGSVYFEEATAVALDYMGYCYAAGYASTSIDGQSYLGGYTDAVSIKYSSTGARE